MTMFVLGCLFYRVLFVWNSCRQDNSSGSIMKIDINGSSSSCNITVGIPEKLVIKVEVPLAVSTTPVPFIHVLLFHLRRNRKLSLVTHWSLTIPIPILFYLHVLEMDQHWFKLWFGAVGQETVTWTKFILTWLSIQPNTNSIPFFIQIFQYFIKEMHQLSAVILILNVLCVNVSLGTLWITRIGHTLIAMVRDNIMTWNGSPHYWLSVRGIHWCMGISLTKDQ